MVLVPMEAAGVEVPKMGDAEREIVVARRLRAERSAKESAFEDKKFRQF